MSGTCDCYADKSLCVSLVGDSDEAKAFCSSFSTRDDSGII